jgi:hypothetical protein
VTAIAGGKAPRNAVASIEFNVKVFIVISRSDNRNAVLLIP